MSHEVCNESKMSGIYSNSICPKNRGNFPHKSCSCSLDSISRQHRPNIVCCEFIHIQNIVITPSPLKTYTICLDCGRRLNFRVLGVLLSIYDITLLYTCEKRRISSRYLRFCASYMLSQLTMLVYKIQTT